MSMGKILGNHKYRIDSPIAKGAFSTVYKCVDLVTGQVYAVKVVNRAMVEANNMRCAVIREINAMELAPPSKYLLNLVDKLESARNYYLVMRLVEGGTLLDYIRRSPFSPSSSVPRRFFRQLLNGLCVLHRSNVVHLDIKPENLLLNKDYTQLIISDFGFARYVPPGRLLHKARGTLRYCAPELLQPKPEYDGRKVDVWAAGVTLYVMLFNTHPFRGDGDSADKLIQTILAGKYSFPRPVSPALEHLFSVTFHLVPEKRWSVKKLLRHAWVLGVEGAVMDIFCRVSRFADCTTDNSGSCENLSEAYLVKSAFARTLEDDDLSHAPRRSRSCPAISKNSTCCDISSIDRGECNMSDDCFSDIMSYSCNENRSNSINYGDSDRAEGGDIGRERRRSTIFDTLFNMDDKSLYSFGGGLTSSVPSSNKGGSTPMGSTYIASKASLEEHPVSQQRDLILTLKAVLNFVLFCLVFLLIAGMRLLFDVDFNDLPIPSFLRAIMGRLLAQPDDAPTESMDHHQQRGVIHSRTLRRVVVLAERAINALGLRRREVPTRAATDGAESNKPSTLSTMFS